MVITLTSDIGQQDFLIGAVKGQLLSAEASLQVHDITHYLSSANFPQAAYICSSAFPFFPEGSLHILLINFFDNRNQRVLIAKHRGQYIACPDNGILTMITGIKPAEVVIVDSSDNCTLLGFTAKIAEAAGKISRGATINEIGTMANDIEEKFPLRPTIGNDWIEGQILFIDHFENVVINITREEFETHRQNRSFKIVIKRDEVIDRISDHYHSVQEGQMLAWFNSAGYLEIAVHKGNMAGLFGLQGYNEKMHQQKVAQHKWFYQTIRIFFE